MNLKLISLAALMVTWTAIVAPSGGAQPQRYVAQQIPCSQEGTFNFKNVPPSSDGIRSLHLFRGANVGLGLVTISNESTSPSAAVEVGFVRSGLSFGGSSVWTTLYPGNSTSLVLSAEGVVLRARSPDGVGRYTVTVIAGPSS
ncbi:MAG: hypothetical protein HY314_14615 [Acidobacteria bacterium]|nr:hypothetical protein [Acidobacteriota bacterium]